MLPQGTHATMDRFMLDHGLEERFGGGSKENRANALATYLIKNPDEANEYGENLKLTLFLAQSLPMLYHAARITISREFSFEKFQEGFPALHRALERDGFTVEDGTLRRTLPDALALPQADDEVHALLDHYGFGTSKGHLDQGIAAHVRRRLGSSRRPVSGLHRKPVG